MPETKAHDRLTLITAGLVTPVALLVPSDNRWLTWGTVTGSYLLSGLLFSNDLDVQAAEYRRWGPLRWLWWPYAHLVLHRSWVSHGLIIGPLLRLIYSALVLELLVVLLTAAAQLFGVGGLNWLNAWHLFWGELLQAHPRRLGEFLVGFVLAGAAHTVPDRFTTGVKRLF